MSEKHYTYYIGACCFLQFQNELCVIVLLLHKECWQTLEALFGPLAKEVCREPEKI